MATNGVFEFFMADIVVLNVPLLTIVNVAPLAVVIFVVFNVF